MNGHEIYHGLIERTCGLFDLATSCTVGMLAGGEVFFGGCKTALLVTINQGMRAKQAVNMTTPGGKKTEASSVDLRLRPGSKLASFVSHRQSESSSTFV